MHKRLIFSLALFSALALVGPTLASAKMIDQGALDPTVKPACPAVPGCTVMSRATGYQTAVGSDKSPMVVKQAGRIVAWTISLSKPTAKQIAYYDSFLGGESSAQLTVLTPTKKTKATPKAKTGAIVSRQGELVKLKQYFGKTVQLALKTSIPVAKGQIVALTVPTWVPALAIGLESSTKWKGSRGKLDCRDHQTQNAQLALKQFSDYACPYDARITYSAQIVTDP